MHVKSSESYRSEANSFFFFVLFVSFMLKLYHGCNVKISGNIHYSDLMMMDEF